MFKHLQQYRLFCLHLRDHPDTWCPATELAGVDFCIVLHKHNRKKCKSSLNIYNSK